MSASLSSKSSPVLPSNKPISFPFDFDSPQESLEGKIARVLGGDYNTTSTGTTSNDKHYTGEQGQGQGQGQEAKIAMVMAGNYNGMQGHEKNEISVGENNNIMNDSNEDLITNVHKNSENGNNNDKYNEKNESGLHVDTNFKEHANPTLITLTPASIFTPDTHTSANTIPTTATSVTVRAGDSNGLQPLVPLPARLPTPISPGPSASPLSNENMGGKEGKEGNFDGMDLVLSDVYKPSGIPVFVNMMHSPVKSMQASTFTADIAHSTVSTGSTAAPPLSPPLNAHYPAYNSSTTEEDISPSSFSVSGGENNGLYIIGNGYNNNGSNSSIAFTNKIAIDTERPSHNKRASRGTYKKTTSSSIPIPERRSSMGTVTSTHKEDRGGKLLIHTVPPLPLPLPSRVVKVAVRVRPFSQLEIQSDARRVVSCNDDKLVIVNPTAFDADPDTIALAAATVQCKEWAQVFRFNHVLW